MEDLIVRTKFKDIKLHDTVKYFKLEQFIEELKEEKFKIYDFECCYHNKNKIVIFGCVEDNSLVSCVIKNVDNFYDTLNSANYYVDVMWEIRAKMNSLTRYDFYVNLEKNFSEKELVIKSDLPVHDDIIYHFSFKVDRNTDVLCTGEECIGYCEISYDDDAEDLKTILKDYLERMDSKYLTGRFFEDVIETQPCKERPYKVYLYGVDDSSYTKTFKTLDEVKDIALCLQMFDKIYTEKFVNEYGFVFTN